jgi:16S rRNA processing protein RimM
MDHNSSPAYVKIGTIFKPSGTLGEVKIDVEDIYLEDLLHSDHIFILLQGNYVPYFIEDIRETNSLLMKIEDISDPESAGQFNQKDMYLQAKSIKSPDHYQKQNIESLVGYMVVHQDKQIAKIDQIDQMPMQNIAWITINKRNLAIPLADALIEKIDHDTKKVYINLPEGILDL